MRIERLKRDIVDAFSCVREKKPLIEQITNYVTINDCANVTLSIGASPVMADSFEEADQMTSISDALVLNFGGIGEKSLDTMIKAGKKANEKGIGVVLDPVGAGATEYRNNSLRKLLSEVHMSIIKGNASEILSLSGADVKTKGVDSSADSNDAIDAAIAVSNKYRCVCAVTGKTDIITDGKIVVKIKNESDLLSYITGTGCMITSLCGSFLGATKKPLVSAICGVASMSISGEIMDEKDISISSYREEVMNSIFDMNANVFNKYSKLEFEKVNSMYSMYLVTDEMACKGKDIYKCVEESILGGAKVVQLREKNLGTRDFYTRAEKLREICKKHDAIFLVNDRIDIALAVDADGVHLGQSDMPIGMAKKLIGHNKIIGITAKKLEEAKEAQESGADYIGIGAIYGTDTKKDSGVISIDMVNKIVDEIDIPVLAIGGIKLENMDILDGTEVDGMCVISDILNNDDCRKRTKDLSDKFNSFSTNL